MLSRLSAPAVPAGWASPADMQVLYQAAIAPYQYNWPAYGPTYAWPAASAGPMGFAQSGPMGMDPMLAQSVRMQQQIYSQFGAPMAAIQAYASYQAAVMALYQELLQLMVMMMLMQTPVGRPAGQRGAPGAGHPGGSAPAGASQYSGPVNSEKARRALDMSAAQMNPATATAVNRNTGQSAQRNRAAWDNWCLAFVATAYGRSVPELAAGSAIASARKFQSAGKLVARRDAIPAGAPVFFAATRSNGNFGHVAIFTGKKTASGDPIIRTSGWPGRSGIWEAPLSQLEKMTGQFIGYGAVA